jgi:hypothetical protein
MTEAEIETACRAKCAAQGINPDEPVMLCWSGGIYSLKDFYAGRKPRPGYEEGFAWMRFWNEVEPVPVWQPPVVED